MHGYNRLELPYHSTEMPFLKTTNELITDKKQTTKKHLVVVSIFNSFHTSAAFSNDTQSLNIKTLVKYSQ